MQEILAEHSWNWHFVAALALAAVWIFSFLMSPPTKGNSGSDQNEEHDSNARRKARKIDPKDDERRAWKRLRDQINSGALARRIGIYKIEDPDGFRKEEKLPAYKGAKWGALIGYGVAVIHIESQSSIGFYPGNMALVFLVCVGLGGAIGALLMWLYDRDQRMRKPE